MNTKRVYAKVTSPIIAFIYPYSTRNSFFVPEIKTISASAMAEISII